MPSEDIKWISVHFQGKDIRFPNETIWRLTEVLAEKDVFFDKRPAEASAIFVCKQQGGANPGTEAVVRVRMQIPRSANSLHPDPKHRAKEASKTPSMYTKMETTALKRLTRASCPYTPKLLSILRQEQDSTMWVPGGWLIFILMEKVPGETLDTFWTASKQRPAMTRSQRDEVRQAFKEALSAIFKCRLCPYDQKRENLLWDAASKKCYIVDLERCEDWHRSRLSLEFADHYYDYWGLTRVNADLVVEW